MDDNKIAPTAHVELPNADGKQDLEAITAFLRVEREMTTWQAVKIHRRLLFFALLPFVCAMNYGYDTVSNGSSLGMPAFLLAFGSVDASGSLYIPSIWTSLWSSMSSLGQALGSFIAGFMAQRVGRRTTAMAFGIVSIAGTCLLVFAKSNAMILVGKIINGTVVGGLMTVGTTYAADIAPVKLRGALLQGLVFFGMALQGVSLGIVRVFIEDMRPIAYKTVFALQWGFAVLVFVVSLLVPESPVFYLAHGKNDKAQKSLKTLYGNTNDMEVRYNAIVYTLEEERKLQPEAVSWIELFKGTNLKRTLTISFIMFSTSAIGIPFLTQNIYFLLTVGLAPVHVFDIGIGGFFLGCVFIALGWLSNEKIGRRTLWIWGLVGNFICMVAIGGLAYSGSQASLWAIAIIMNLLISYGVYTTVGVAWTICPEISSLRLRQYSQSVAFLSGAIGGWLFSFITLYLYNVDSGNLGAKTGLVYAAFTVVVFVVSWFLIPETAGRTVEDIDAAYVKGISPRHFHKFQTSIQDGDETMQC